LIYDKLKSEAIMPSVVKKKLISTSSSNGRKSGIALSGSQVYCILFVAVKIKLSAFLNII